MSHEPIHESKATPREDAEIAREIGFIVSELNATLDEAKRAGLKYGFTIEPGTCLLTVDVWRKLV